MSLYETLGKTFAELEEVRAENRQLIATLAKLKSGEISLDNIRVEQAGEPASAPGKAPEEGTQHGEHSSPDKKRTKADNR